jgi:carbon starvation protein CstA
MVMLRKQDTLILSELYINDHFCAVRAMIAWMRFELTTLVVIGTDSCKSNYHMITTTPRWHINVVKTIITLIEILHHTLTILWYQEDESILNNKNTIIAAVSVTTFFVYLLVRYEHDVQDAINILWTA